MDGVRVRGRAGEVTEPGWRGTIESIGRGRRLRDITGDGDGTTELLRD